MIQVGRSSWSNTGIQGASQAQHIIQQDIWSNDTDVQNISSMMNGGQTKMHIHKDIWNSLNRSFFEWVIPGVFMASAYSSVIPWTIVTWPFGLWDDNTWSPYLLDALQTKKEEAYAAATSKSRIPKLIRLADESNRSIPAVQPNKCLLSSIQLTFQAPGAEKL